MENLKCLFSNFPWDIFLFWLLPLLLLWWWLNRSISRYKTHASELQDRINFLEGELEACRKSKISASVESSAKSASTDLGAAAIAAAGIAAPVASFAEKPKKKDDLKIVEGIGPKIEELCHKAGILTFEDLSNASVATLKGILEEAGSRFQMHDPTTWPKQAELARDGKWDELKAWQDELNKGKE